jgi:hypothetical protein
LPNALAYLVFWSSPLVAALLFLRYRLETALTLTIMLGYLFLPGRVAFNLPGLPVINKGVIPAVSALVLCLIFQGRDQAGREYWRRAGWLPRSPLVLICLGLFVLGPIGTVITNADPVRIGDTLLPGLVPYDMGNLVNIQLATILPFLLARRYLATEDAQAIVLKIMVGLGLVYSVLILAEWRLSPFWNEMFYGFRAAHWNQIMRGDGYRPLVFLKHGLWTAIFTAMACIATASLWRTMAGHRNRGLVLGGLAWMLLTLLFSNSFGALLIAALLVPATMLLPDAKRLLTAVVVASMVLLYPMLRSADYVPTMAIVETISQIDSQRAASLEYRIEQEDELLARANQRALFGWGGWGRNRVYDEAGTDTSVTDGRWIIVFGMFGWTGYLGEYGLMTLPLILLYRRRRQVGSLGVSIGLAMILAGNLLDIIPNATLEPLSWLLAGTVLGRAELAAKDTAPTSSTAETRQPTGRGARPVLGLAAPGGQARLIGGSRKVVEGDAR